MMQQRIVAFAGRKGSGKDEAGRQLIREGYKPVKFADALKGMLRFYLMYRGVDNETIERMIEGDLKEVETPYFEGKTPRWAMQSLGTEWGRDCIGNDIWINATKDRCDSIDAWVVITDLRFDNESQACEKWGARRIRIERPNAVINEASDHPSETAIDNLDVDAVVQNSGTLDQFHKMVSKVAS
jgi:hypothetical protein